MLIFSDNANLLPRPAPSTRCSAAEHQAGRNSAFSEITERSTPVLLYSSSYSSAGGPRREHSYLLSSITERSGRGKPRLLLFVPLFMMVLLITNGLCFARHATPVSCPRPRLSPACKPQNVPPDYYGPKPLCKYFVFSHCLGTS